MANRLLPLLLTLALATPAAQAQVRPQYRRVLQRGQWVMLEWRDGAYRPLEASSDRRPSAPRRSREATASSTHFTGDPEDRPSPWPWQRPEHDEYHQEIMALLEFDLALANHRGEWRQVRDLFLQVRTLAHETRQDPEASALAVSPETYRMASEAFRRSGDLGLFFQIQDGYLPLVRHDSPERSEVLSELGLVLDAYHTPLERPPGIAQLHADVATLRTWLSVPKPPKALDDAATRARQRAFRRLEALRLAGPPLHLGRRRLRRRWPEMERRVIHHREMVERRLQRQEAAALLEQS